MQSYVANACLEVGGGYSSSQECRARRRMDRATLLRVRRWRRASWSRRRLRHAGTRTVNTAESLVFMCTVYARPAGCPGCNSLQNVPHALTIAQRINAERLMILAWPRAILLQLAHPLVAAG